MFLGANAVLDATFGPAPIGITNQICAFRTVSVSDARRQGPRGRTWLKCDTRSKPVTHAMADDAVTRPALALERLRPERGRQVVYTLKTPHRDGTTRVVLAPLD